MGVPGPRHKLAVPVAHGYVPEVDGFLHPGPKHTGEDGPRGHPPKPRGSYPTCASRSGSSPLMAVSEAASRGVALEAVERVIRDERDECVHDLGVELGAGAVLDLLEGHFDRAGAPVRPGTDHGVERVRHGEDPG